METDTILTIVSIILGLGATVLGGKWLAAKGKLTQFKNVVKEGYDVVKVTIEIVDDDKVTKEEIAQVKQEAAEFKAAVKLLLGKNP